MSEPPQSPPGDTPQVDPTLRLPSYGTTWTPPASGPDYGEPYDLYRSAPGHPDTTPLYGAPAYGAPSYPPPSYPPPSYPPPSYPPPSYPPPSYPPPTYAAPTPADGQSVGAYGLHGAPEWWPPAIQTGTAWPPPPPQRPASHLGAALVATVLLCWPLGAVALYHALQVDRLYDRGDVAGSRRASDRAGAWLVWAVAMGLAWIALVVLFFLIRR